MALQLWTKQYKIFASIDSSGKDKSIPLKILIENRNKRVNDSLKKLTIKNTI